MDSLTKTEMEDTLAFGTIDKKGKSSLVVSKRAFHVIQKGDNLQVSIIGFTREKIKSVKTKGKKIVLKISASGRGPIMGKF